MGRVFTEQTYLRIILTAGVNVAGALTTSIIYKTPSGVLGTLDATVQDQATGIMYHDVPVDSSGGTDLLTEVGKWKFWTYVEFSDGRTARGETYTKQIYDKDDNC